MKILFVCHGNICRSPMAEIVMRDLLRRTGLCDGFTGYGHDTLGHGIAQTDSAVNGGIGGNVEHGAANADRQLCRGNFSAGEGLNQLLFRTLGVAGGQHS